MFWKSKSVISSAVVTLEVVFCPLVSFPFAVPNGKGIPLLLEEVPKLLELPPLLPSERVAVVVKLSAASVASGVPSLSESVSLLSIIASSSVSLYIG